MNTLPEALIRTLDSAFRQNIVDAPDIQELNDWLHSYDLVWSIKKGALIDITTGEEAEIY